MFNLKKLWIFKWLDKIADTLDFRATYPLFVWINLDLAFDTFLCHVRPWVSRHPLALALCTFVFAEATFFTLVRSTTFVLLPRLLSKKKTQKSWESSKSWKMRTKYWTNQTHFRLHNRARYATQNSTGGISRAISINTECAEKNTKCVENGVRFWLLSCIDWLMMLNRQNN